MSLILGIDTGGTYTDGVVVELAGKKIISRAKALTTREDLALGIANCINNLSFMDFKKISVVSLSTTLATNAIVEGRGCEVGLILIGHQPVQKLPVEHFAVVPGGHDIKGKPLAPLDMEKTREAIKEFKGKVGAVAISGYLSVRNPEHELIVRDLVQEILDVPVVCAHQLTTSLGFHERTVTAALNARLIPIIAELIESVKRVLKSKRIDAPIMIVKGDGCLMSETLAREKPIDTILSGPAASIIGATFLTDISEALVLDMGGTTTDIAILHNGVPRINKEGAMVGGWLTRVQAAEISTYGVGGDSYLHVSKEGKLLVGPQRVWPLAVVACKSPYLVEELRSNLDKNYELMFAQETDCFMLLKPSTSEGLSEVEKEIVATLESGPHSIFYLSAALGKDPNLFNFNMQRLINLGIVARISVTPTDILHAKGTYTEWNRDAAALGARFLARRLRMSLDEFLEFASETIVQNLCLTVLQSLVSSEGKNFWLQDDAVASYFIDKALKPKEHQPLDCVLKVNMPIIGIGAPVRAWLPQVAKKLCTELLIPENAEVANAVGAATGKIMESIKILIKPGEGGSGYIVHTPWMRRSYLQLGEATAFALEEAKKQAALAAEKAGALDYELVVNHDEIYTGSAGAEKDIYVESRIEVTAVGRPEWEREKEREKFFVDTVGC
ncbi:hydantoinase/oxoprolinase N-terminal domain-containing protein [Zhaonella formicivorans]|uniref:hydantoinase/oxoprolinase N-terminal domain-containing protein n=1 Tax=Zhaonella formicivorans TaxID=2528593 RepID=UPI0010D298DE|nr:hydantoinase/oxoprolinase family protein [Zhaonella formicivorans]